MIGAPLGGWLTLAALGAFHGMNPGMGWLLAVGIGMQEESRIAVWRALVVIALGHLVAVVTAVLVANALGVLLSPGVVRWGVALFLVGLSYRSVRGHRHGGTGGMRMRPWELFAWSFLMASGHGAGLMVIPLAGATHTSHLSHGKGEAGAAMASAWVGAPSVVSGSSAFVASFAHSVGFIAASALLALLIYESGALSVLRRAWVNLELLWGAALLVTAGVIAVG